MYPDIMDSLHKNLSRVGPIPRYEIPILIYIQGSNLRRGTCQRLVFIMNV